MLLALAAPLLLGFPSAPPAPDIAHGISALASKPGFNTFVPPESNMLVGDAGACTHGPHDVALDVASSGDATHYWVLLGFCAGFYIVFVIHHCIYVGPLDCLIDICFMPWTMTFLWKKYMERFVEDILCLPSWTFLCYCICCWMCWWSLKAKLKIKTWDEAWRKSKKAKKIEEEETPEWV